MSSTRKTRIRVPTRQVQGGFDFKFVSDSYDVPLHGIMSSEDYTMIVDRVNQKIKPARSNAIDKGLLITGPLIVPLALWGARHSLQSRRRKRLLGEAIREFNESYPEHLMRWNRGGPESFLTIERREHETTQNGMMQPAPNSLSTMPHQQQSSGVAAAPPFNESAAQSSFHSGGNGMMMAEAKLVV